MSRNHCNAWAPQCLFDLQIWPGTEQGRYFLELKFAGRTSILYEGETEALQGPLLLRVPQNVAPS